VNAMYQFVEIGIHMTWKECCEMAIKDELPTYSSLTVMTWYRELTESLSLKFRHSERGRNSVAAKSPVAEDESLMIQLKGWGRANLEKLSVDSAREWINEMLLSKWTTEQLTNLNISYPVSPHIASLASGMKHIGRATMPINMKLPMWSIPEKSTAAGASNLSCKSIVGCNS
jgi:hypothetical protein